MKKIQFVILLTQLLLIPIFCFSESAKEPSPEEELPAEMALTGEKTAFFVSQKAFAEYYYDVAVRALSTFVELFPASENACDAYLLLGQACFQLKGTMPPRLPPETKTRLGSPKLSSKTVPLKRL